MLPLLVVCAVTGFLSHGAYEPDLGRNATFPADGLLSNLYWWTWPTDPAWLYALNQGLHVACGLMAIPLLLAKLWAVIPKLFEWPPLRSPAHAIERLSLGLLVGGSIFVLGTGVMNIQYWYAWRFSFVPAHYYGAIVFLAALAVHVAGKWPALRAALRERGLRPLRDDLADTRPEPGGPHTSAPVAPAPPTITRRALLGTVGAGSALLGLTAAGQSIGGPLRGLAVLAPRGPDAAGPGPNDFPVNNSARAAGIVPARLEGWRLTVAGGPRGDLVLSRDQLLALDLATEGLPIACVEGWSTWQAWTGVRVRDLLARAGVREPRPVLVSSLQEGGAFSSVTLSAAQAGDPQTLLALRVNGADLSLDHGFPARLIIPAAPGVHNTKWVRRMEIQAT
jgi:DMSO/TMAO reductase YedYZ molybdopterin-dependent catalytic subunit